MLSGLVLGAIAQLSVVHAETSIPKPNVPEFTVKLVDRSYDVPPSTTTTIDPYTGKETVTNQPGRRVENKTIEVAIKNQPFSSRLMYNIRIKGHFEQGWRELYCPSDGYLWQSDSQYTVISLPANYPVDAKIDFQVEALNGYISREYDGSNAGPFSFPWTFTGEKSGWSNTQVLTVEANSVGEAEKSKVNPNQQLGAQPAVNQLCINWTEISLCAILGTISAVLIIALVYKRKRFSKGNTLAYQP